MYIIIIVILSILFLYFKNKNSFQNKQLFEDYINEWEWIRENVFNEYWKYCSKCWSCEKLDIHHKIPKSLWWRDNLDNLTVLCRECHENEHWYHIDDKSKNTMKKISSNNMKIVSDSIYDWYTIYIIYKSRFNKKITKREIKCIELYKKEYVSSRWYRWYHWMVKAYCFLRNWERNFYIRDIKEIIKIN